MDKAREEFQDIYNQNIDQVYRFVYLKVGSKEIAEDLTAEAFTKAWNVFKDRYDKKNKISNPKAFCYKTARNSVIDYYRRNSLRRIVPIDSVAIKSKEDLQEKMAINSDLKQVLDAMKSIKDDYQNIIIWRYLDELSIGEISDIINKSEGATRVMVHRAMESLRNVLES